MINGVVYDTECGPNYFTYSAFDIASDTEWYFEISQYRNDAVAFWYHLDAIRQADAYMVGFNNIGYDYNLIHAFFVEPVGFGPEKFYAISQRIINSFDRFGETIRYDDRFIKQIDLYKIHHFDNKAKSTSLKALQVNMRADNVLESELPFNTPLTAEQINGPMRHYGRHDVVWTKKFALISMPMIDFRLQMAKQISGDVLNFNDTKIGKQLLEQRLSDVCYEWQNGRRVRRQTIRHSIRLAECVFPYIRFQHPEFQRVHNWIMAQSITETKGVFDGLSATINGFTFHFGTGGIHGSLERAKIAADDEWAIVDDDVAGYYPSITVANRLAPAHLGQRFVEEYRKIIEERRLYKKGTPENSSLKLAGNGVYGDSNSEYSVFYDPQFTMSITINGQLLLCMLAEWLITVPTLSLIQINTDGVTYHVRRDYLPMVEEIRKSWQAFTLLELEQARYSRVWIRDVNNYVAETEGTGKLKTKGAYWTPDKHPDDIQNASPTAWYKNFSVDICAKAAVAHMVKGTDIETFVYSWSNMFDFMLREKTARTHKLFIGDKPQQVITRYFVALRGEPMRKVLPSTHPHRLGQFKQARGVSDDAYNVWQSAWGNVHNPEIHTKNKSTYDPERVTNVNVGMLVQECNHVDRFDWLNLNYDWYIAEARKLVI